MHWGDIFYTALGSGAFSSLVTYSLNRGFNNKKLHAEIVSKARIDWINEFRELSSNYLYEAHRAIEERILKNEFGKYYENSCDDSDDEKRYSEKYKQHNEKFNEHVKNMSKYFIQLSLYLPEKFQEKSQKEHEKIKDDAKFLSDKIGDIEEDLTKEDLEELQKENMKKLADYIGQYLKQEWDIAKKKK